MEKEPDTADTTADAAADATTQETAAVEEKTTPMEVELSMVYELLVWNS